MNPNPPYSPDTIESVAPNEAFIFQTGKHSFGIIAVYLQVLVGLAAAVSLVVFLLPSLVGDGNLGQVQNWLSIAGVLIGGFLLLIMLAATYVYRQNKLIVTDRNVTQIIQRGLFSRQVSELSLGSVEDVTADKRGMLATMFDFGELRIETAGEQNNFHFNYCPRPNYYGKLLLDAKQRYLQTHDEK